MKKLLLIISLLLLTACSQHVTLEPVPTGVGSGPLYEANETHRGAQRYWRYREGISEVEQEGKWLYGNCVAWTDYMSEQRGLSNAAPVLATIHGQRHMVLGIWHEDGFFVSDINHSGIVHINNAGLGNDLAVWDGDEWVKAEIVVR